MDRVKCLQTRWYKWQIDNGVNSVKLLSLYQSVMLMLRGNRVKTELRNRLTVSTLDNLLRIPLKGPENDFDFNAAVRRWGALIFKRFFPFLSLFEIETESFYWGFSLSVPLVVKTEPIFFCN